ncbi:hypothetical protein FOZ62_016024, partial [Perkinsus olseni]
MVASHKNTRGSDQQRGVVKASRNDRSKPWQQRFEHTILCLTNGEAELFNQKHLDEIDGDEVVFPAKDTRTQLTPIDFDDDEVSKLGYRSTIALKPRCRVMATVNHPQLIYCNGSQGTVVDIELSVGHPPKVL